MTLSQSKLMLQLSKEQKIHHRFSFHQELVQELYSTICKLQPKNLMLVEFLSLIIERDFIKNSNKLVYFADLYEQIKGKNLDQDHNYNKNSLQIEQQKFSKKKFIKLLKELSKKLYPSNPNAYETVLFERLTKIDNQQHRIKIDQSVRRMFNKETIYAINQIDQQLQAIFQIYMPQNYNLNLQFSWDQIKVLQKKLPILCFFRFLYETEVIPHFLSPVQFMEIFSKLKPPVMPNSNSSKQAMFYTSETMVAYLRDHINLPQIKLLQGDVGLTFLQFQIFFIKIATEFSKDSKNEYSNNIKKFAIYIKLKEAFDQSSPRRNRFMEIVKTHMKNIGNKNQKIVVKKRQSRKKIEDLYDSKDIDMKEEATKDIYKTMSVEPRDIQIIKKDLDNQLGQLPQKKKIQKQNQGYYDIQKKHIVIGQQLPKIQQKTKSSASKQTKKKNQDSLLGYKPQITRQIQQTDIKKMIHRPKKMRTNTQFPITLNQIFYPSDLNNQLFISPKAEVYLETSYIHMGQRLYEQAFLNYMKAKSFNESKSSVTQFYYNIHAAQIFQSAGRDDVALSFYHKSKELLGILTSIEGSARSHPYIGMGTCLYHMDQYQYALRCFQKAKTVLGINLEIQSIQNAILQNNVGCCLMMLNRNQQAIKYFEISHSVFDLKAGCFDERTLVVQQNYNKNRKAYLELLPQFKTMWKTYIEKSTTKLPSVKQSGKLGKQKK